jgi:hypothetical protein
MAREGDVGVDGEHGFHGGGRALRHRACEVHHRRDRTQIQRGLRRSFLEWADEHEAWLRFVRDSGALPHYLPRLRGPKARRDEALAEMAPAYFFATKCSLSIFEWEPDGANGKRGEFFMGFDKRAPVFVEVKAPGWRTRSRRVRVRRAHACGSPSTLVSRPARQPRGRPATPSSRRTRRCPVTSRRCSSSTTTSWWSLLDWTNMVGDIGLYAPKSSGHESGSLAESGPFADSRFERLVVAEGGAMLGHLI